MANAQDRVIDLSQISESRRDRLSRPRSLFDLLGGRRSRVPVDAQDRVIRRSESRRNRNRLHSIFRLFDGRSSPVSVDEEVDQFIDLSQFWESRLPLPCLFSDLFEGPRSPVPAYEVAHLLCRRAACGSKESMKEDLFWFQQHGLLYLINEPDKNGKRPLHWAAIHDNVGSLEALAKWSEVDLNACDKDGRTALQLAVMRGKLKAVTLLCKGLPQFASNLLPNIKDKYGQTALDYAVDMNQVAIEMELKNREDVQVYIDGLYKERQMYVDKANAILAFSTAVTTLSIASTFGAALASATNSGAYFVLRKHSAVTSSTILAVIFGIAASVTAILSYNPKRHIGATVVYVRRTSQVAFMMLLIAVSCFLVAITLAGRAVLTMT